MGESSPTPFSSPDTLGTICTLAAGYVLMPDDDEAIEIAAAGVRRAIDRLNTRKWRWALSYQDITFVAEQQSYDLNEDFKAPRRFTIFDVNSREQFRLDYKEWTTFADEDLVSISGSGDPYCYSSGNSNDYGTISLNVAPSSTWVATYPTGRIWYFRRVAYPVISSDPILVPSEVGGFLLASAEAFCAARYAPDKESSARVRAEMLLKELRIDDLDTQTDWEN